MTTRQFVTLAFRGARFEGESLPVEVLPELSAYRELVVAVAKALYQAQNPSRQRLPKRFEAGFELVLERIDRGSIVPVISRILRPQGTPMFGEQPLEDLFDQARDRVEHIIATCGSDESPTEGTTKDILGRFITFGRTLQPDETIGLTSHSGKPPTVYGRRIRQALLLKVQQSYEDDVNLVGEVRALDKDKGYFSLKTTDGKKIDVRITPLFLPSALTSLKEEALVRVRGNGVFTPEGVLQRVSLATDVSLAEEGEELPTRPGCSTPIESQIQSLRSLMPGWYDGTGLAYDPAALDWLQALLGGVVEGFQLPIPHTYPTPEGAARAEWTSRRWGVVAVIHLAQKTAELVAAEMDSDVMEDCHLEFSEPGAEVRLGRFVADHLLES